jgi:DNA polymerase-1
MTKSEINDHVHIDENREYLFSSALAESDMEWVEANPAIVEPIIAARRNKAGFYVSFPAALEAILHHSRTPMLSIDIETTQLTPYSPAIKMTNKSQIGGECYNKYLARHPDCTINTTPRLRILAVQALGGPCPGNYIFDLDAFTPQDRQRLIDCVMDGHTIIGHNVIGFDGYWSMRLTSKRPKRWLDTLILTRQVRPDFLHQNNFTAATGSEEMIEDAVEALTASAGKDRASLANIASNLFNRKLDKTFQTPQSWCVSKLSREHFDYVLSDISLPVEILRCLFGTVELDCILHQINTRHRPYIAFMRAAETVASMKGVPFSEPAADALSEKMKAAIISEVDSLAETADQNGVLLFPEFGSEALALLRDPQRSLTCKPVLADIQKHAQTHQLQLPVTDKGNISIADKQMKLAGLDKTLPAWPHLEKISELKKGLETIKRFREFAKFDGLLHPQLAFITEAGRANCSSPNLQGTPRDSEIRGLIRVGNDEAIVDLDYSGIELRVAAVNVQRAIDSTKRLLIYDWHTDNPTESWYTANCAYGRNCPEQLPFPSDSTKPDDMSIEDWQKQKPGRLIQYFAQRTLNTPVQALTGIFNGGIDVHLVTALGMLRTAGKDYAEGDIAEWLSTLSQEQLDELKDLKDVKRARQLAKVYNFGLLYGMKGLGLYEYGISQFGVNWTQEEAAAGMDTWFQAYPEVGLWQCWSMYAKGSKVPASSVKLYNKWTNEVETPKYDPKIFENETLLGRQLSIIKDQFKIFSYQGQGSGVDILATAIYKLPPHLKVCLVLAVHDELLLVCKKENAEQYRAELKQIMIDAGKTVLGDLVPVEVDGGVSQCWKK